MEFPLYQEKAYQPPSLAIRGLGALSGAIDHMSNLINIIVSCKDALLSLTL